MTTLTSLDHGLASAPARPMRLSTWSIAWRYLVVGAVYVGSISADLGLTIEPERWPLYRIIIDVVLGAGALVAVWWRRRWPLWIVVGISLAVVVAPSAIGALAWSYVSLATRRRWRELAVAFPAAWIACVASSWLEPGPMGEASGTPATVFDPGTIAFLIFAVVTGFVVGLLLTGWGFYLGARRDLIASLRARAEEAEAAQGARLAQGQAMERARIAREMHDVLAHRISLVSMHAGVLAYRTDLTSDQTRQVAQIIQENAHASLTELRGVLGSLRSQDGDGVPEAPQPTIADIADLIAQARAAGARIEVVDEIESPETMSKLTGRHAYRVVQELLTNARKHAPQAPVHLILRGTPASGLSIVSRNRAAGTGSDVPGSQVGLVGLAERAAIVGGRISHGTTPAGEWVINVWLPWTP